MDKSDSIYAGEWWLEQENIRLSGRLTLSEDRKQIKLQVFGCNYIDGTYIEEINSERQRPKCYHEVIFGNVRGKLMLYQCNLSGTKLIGKGLYQIDYIVAYAFLDHSIEDSKALLVKAGEFIYPAFKSFMYTDNYFGPQSKSTQDSSLEENTAIIEIKENLKIKFQERRREYIKSPIDEINYWSVLFIYDTPVRFDTLVEDGIYFKKLIEFSYGSHCNCQLPNVWFEMSNPSQVWNTSLNKGENVSQQSRASYHMLLSDNNFDDRNGMIRAIRLWFKYQRVSTIFDLYIDSNYWLDKSEQKLSSVMYNNRFLNIVQALESFHRVTFSSQKPNISKFNDRKDAVLSLFKGGEEQRELKQWLNNNLNPPKEINLKSRLNHLVKWLKPEIDRWFTNQSTIEHFAWYASAMRNVLSHGMHRQTKPPKELRLFMITGQVLLAACILKALKVKDVGKAILGYQRFEDHLYEINHTIINKIS